MSQGVVTATARRVFSLVLLTTPKPPTPALAAAPAATAAVASPLPSLATSPYASVLLGLKKRGFGTGKWNGFGGKVEPGETIRQAAIREMKEEAGIDLDPSTLSRRGVLLEEFENDPTLLEIHVFLATTYTGVVSESDEMRPAWFDVSEEGIPYKSMWIDDEVWLPWIMNDRYFRAEFLLRGHDLLLKHAITQVDASELQQDL